MPLAYPRSRMLILVAQPEYLATEDLVSIRDKVRQKVPNLRVMIVGRGDRANLINQELWQLPTLTVSFGPLGSFKPLRGPVFSNNAIPKIEQFRILSSSGIRTPKTALFQYGMDLPMNDWGEFVILKPANLSMTSSGRGLYIYRSKQLSEIRLADLPLDHVARHEQMLVQSFVYTGPHFSVYRCLTLFGEVIYQNIAISPHPHPNLFGDDNEIAGIVPEPPRHETTPQINTDADVMSFARSIHSAFPQVPLLGCDILRDHQSGLLYAIEVNAGGNVWHLSSPRTRNSRSITKIQQYLQTFRSYDKAAEALVRAVSRYAA